jgi:glycosyltransferase involved in cell wall biosynthesis
VLLSLLQSLDPAEFRAVVFSTGEGQELRGEFEAACARLILRTKKFSFDFSLIPSLARVIREERPNVVVSNLFYADIIAGLAKAVISAPLISWQHAAPSTDTKNNRWYHRRAFHMVKKRYSRFICCSKFLCDDLDALYRIGSERSVTIHNWVDTDCFLFHPVGAGGDRMTIGNVCRFSNGKGHEQLLRAFRKIKDEIPNADLVLVGDGPIRGDIQLMAADLGMANCTRFLGAQVDVESILPQFDIFVLASQVEAFPVCLLEAMACGRSVVAYDIPGVREAITHGQTGLLAPSGDEDALGRCVIDLCHNRELRADLGIAARKDVENRFERVRQTEKFIQVMREVSVET